MTRITYGRNHEGAHGAEGILTTPTGSLIRPQHLAELMAPGAEQDEVSRQERDREMAAAARPVVLEQATGRDVELPAESVLMPGVVAQTARRIRCPGCSAGGIAGADVGSAGPALRDA